MARTMAQLVSRVRETLQDLDGTRYPTHQLVGYTNDAVVEARSVRPDVFVGTFGEEVLEVPEDARDEALRDLRFPLPDQFFPAVCFYVAGRAELRDDEFAVDGRAMTLLSAFAQKMRRGY